MISYNEELDSHRVAHRFISWSDWAAMVVRSQGFEMQERSGEVRWEGTIGDWVRCWDDMIRLADNS